MVVDRGRHVCAGEVVSVQHDEMRWWLIEEGKCVQHGIECSPI